MMPFGSECCKNGILKNCTVANIEGVTIMVNN